MADDPERLKVLKEAEYEDPGTSDYIAALAWPRGRSRSRNLV